MRLPSSIIGSSVADSTSRLIASRITDVGLTVLTYVPAPLRASAPLIARTAACRFSTIASNTGVVGVMPHPQT